MAKKNTSPRRIAPPLDKIIKTVMAKNLMRGKQVSGTRVTLAIARQYNKRPDLLKELEDAELK